MAGQGDVSPCEVESPGQGAGSQPGGRAHCQDLCGGHLSFAALTSSHKVELGVRGIQSKLDKVGPLITDPPPTGSTIFFFL